MFPWRQAPLAAASRGQKGIALNRFFRCSQTPSLSAIYKQIIADRIITPFLYLFFSSHNDILPLLFFLSFPVVVVVVVVVVFVVYFLQPDQANLTKSDNLPNPLAWYYFIP